MRNIWVSSLILTCVLATTGRAQQKAKPSSVSAMSPASQKLEVWAGRWTITGQAKETPYSHASTFSSETTCGWSANRGYMLCDQLINLPTGAINQLSVYTYSETDKSYKFFGLDQNSDPRVIPLTIEGNVWTYGGKPFDDHGKQILIRTLNEFVSPALVNFRTEYSDDGGAHWTLMNEGKDIKVK